MFWHVFEPPVAHGKTKAHRGVAGMGERGEVGCGCHTQVGPQARAGSGCR